MTISRNMHVLSTPDLERSAAFYATALKFEIHEMGDPGWRLFKNGSCRIMVGHCPDDLPVDEIGMHSYYAYLVVEDVDAYLASAMEAGAEITKALQDEPWGMREFGLKTPDGHRLMVGQDL